MSFQKPAVFSYRMLKIIDTVEEMTQICRELKSGNKLIGFVPTMGALHKGHISLINNSKSNASVSIVSIFVNPLQFNEKSDYEIYPRTLEEDIKKLRELSCDYLFLPSEKDVYSEDKNKFLNINISYLENVFEGQIRPGHFKGVALVVKRLFEIIQPDQAYFGQKDYQQFLVIQKLVDECKFKVKLQMCPVIREFDGLAMSSRNRFLSEHQRKNAALIFKALILVKQNYNLKPISEAKEEAIKKIEWVKDFKVEYLEVCDSTTLKPINNWNESGQIVVLVAVKLPKLRLIDNILINNK